MADFITGADLVARGAEGTGAATVLNSQPTIQNLARLAGRMDNLYKTQEMLKLKLAAAKQKEAKLPKQPTLNPITTGGVTGEYLGAIGNQFMQGIAAIKGSKYNQKVSSNDIAGANQEAADAASALATLNPVVQNTDKVIKSYLTDNADYYQLDANKPLEIASRFPTIKQDELAQIQDPAKKEEYIFGKYNQFLQADPNRIVRDVTLYDPRTYNYKGIFGVLDKSISDRKVEVKNASGTGYMNNISEMFDTSKPGRVSLNYDKAIGAISQLPVARSQMEVMKTLAENEAKTKTVAFSTLPQEKQDAIIKDARRKAEERYADSVFVTGLTLEQRKDYESTKQRAESEAGGRLLGEAPPQIAQGVFRFNRQTDLNYYQQGKRVGSRPADYAVVASGETMVMKDPVKIDANSVFLPMGRFNVEDRKSLNAREFKNQYGNVNNLFVGDKSFTLTNAKKVTGMPVFTMRVTDSNTDSIVYEPGDWVPEHMMTATKIRGGKKVPYLEKQNYILADGYVGSPEVNVEVGKDMNGNPIYEKTATTQNFYPDENSKDLVLQAIRNGMKNAPSNIFERAAQERQRKKK